VDVWLASGAELHSLTYTGSYPMPSTIKFMPASGNSDRVFAASSQFFQKSIAYNQTATGTKYAIKLLTYFPETSTLWAGLGTALISIPLDNSATPPVSLSMPEPVWSLVKLPDLIWASGLSKTLYAVSSSANAVQPYSVGQSVFNMTSDPGHHWLWLGSKCLGISPCSPIGAFDPASHQFVTGPTLAFQEVTDLLVGADGTLWLGTDQGVYLLKL